MKVRPYDRSTLWRSAFAERENDLDGRDREALAEAYRQLRDRAGILVGEIHAALPQLTVHDLTHADTLWDVASEICGPEYKLNPLEGFVLGASFLLHDAGMALAAYPNGLTDLKNSLEWRDAVASAWKKRGVEDPNDSQRSNPEASISDDATFQVLRAKHASQARALVTALWTQPSTGRPLALVQNDDLLESYGLLIGNISASHHWPLPEVGRYFGDPTPASAAWPRVWEVDGLSLACILRCADACAIDETRAPSFLFAIRKPSGESKRHWTFQNKIYPAKSRDDSLIFESKSAFPQIEADDWWLCFDAIDVANRELSGSDALLTDRKRRPFSVRRVIGAGHPDILLHSVKVEGWKPINTLPKISDPQSIIERLGGRQLYGDDPVVPIRELIQNSVDAIRARRFMDPRFLPAENNQYPGQILLEIARIPESNDYWVSIEDNGIGMSERTITRSLLDFGTSFWSSEAAAELYPGLPSERKFKPIGRFGIGFFSVFMYSSVVVVMSREFRSALDSWNVLSFDKGVRGRANLSVEKMPTEIVGVDTSTRIKIRVNQDYIGALDSADYYRRLGRSSEVQPIFAILRDLVCALDVQVRFAFCNGDRIVLNSPLIYEKGADAVWNFFKHGNYSENQKQLLIPLGGGEHEYYGYCGVNLGRLQNAVIKSVGGLGRRYPDGAMDPIVGVAEYKVEAATRLPDELAAPKDVIDTWSKEQIARILRLPLADVERERAAMNLGSLINDIRPIFKVLTSEGYLDLETLVQTIQKKKTTIFPVIDYFSDDSESSIEYYPHLPRWGNEINLRMSDIDFEEFAIHPDSGVLSISRGPEGKVYPSVARDAYRSAWSTIINSLRDSNADFELSFHKLHLIGSYLGLDSPRHKLKGGDKLKSDILMIKLKD